MAKKKDNAEHEQDEFNPGVQDTPQKFADSIESEEDAIEYVRKNFNVPEHVKTVFVAQDRNVFYRSNTASVHAKQNNLKLFAIKWD